MPVNRLGIGTRSGGLHCAGVERHTNLLAERIHASSSHYIIAGVTTNNNNNRQSFERHSFRFKFQFEFKYEFKFLFRELYITGLGLSRWLYRYRQDWPPLFHYPDLYTCCKNVNILHVQYLAQTEFAKIKEIYIQGVYGFIVQHFSS